MSNVRTVRGLVRLSASLLAALMALGACAAPPAADQSAATAPPAVAAPEQAAPGTPPPAAVQIDSSCATDADCTVKDVGNCCGYYPACVNVDSPTDPEGVKAACAESGRMSVCGFPVIEGCQCVEGRCEAQSPALPAVE